MKGFVFGIIEKRSHRSLFPIFLNHNFLDFVQISGSDSLLLGGWLLRLQLLLLNGNLLDQVPGLLLCDFFLYLVNVDAELLSVEVLVAEQEDVLGLFA